MTEAQETNGELCLALVMSGRAATAMIQMVQWYRAVRCGADCSVLVLYRHYSKCHEGQSCVARYGIDRFHLTARQGTERSPAQGVYCVAPSGLC